MWGRGDHGPYWEGTGLLVESCKIRACETEQLKMFRKAAEVKAVFTPINQETLESTEALNWKQRREHNLCTL